jgi:hypothetical protein
MQRRGTTAPKKPAAWRTSIAGSLMGLSNTIRSSVDEEETQQEEEKEEESPSKSRSLELIKTRS